MRQISVDLDRETFGFNKSMQETQVIKNKKDISDTQIDVVELFERVIRIETKLDLHLVESKSYNKWIQMLFIIVIMIELFNVLLNFLMIRGR